MSYAASTVKLADDEIGKPSHGHGREWFDEPFDTQALT